jgi:hypothetical protein
MDGRTICRPVRIVVICCLLAGLPAAWAHAAEPAADLEQKSTTAFALGRFAEAAAEFEKAFESSPQPALLYNAAQAYRMAGNKERALTLYQNYLRVYGTKEKRAEVESRIDELTKAIEHDKAVAMRPPNEPEPIVKAPTPPSEKTPPPVEPLAVAPAAPAVPAAPPEPAAPVLVAKPGESAPENRPLTSRPLFWAAIGGAVVVAAVVVIVLASGGSKDPAPTFGTAKGN